ncbi:hypothetical protein D3C76_1062660 [compost metagenome]
MQIPKPHVQRLHSQRPTGLDSAIELRYLVFADEVTDRWCAEHDLMSSHPPASYPLQQCLRNHRLQ